MTASEADGDLLHVVVTSVLDEDPSPPEGAPVAWRTHEIPTPTIVGSGLALVALWEVAATTVNRALDTDAVPSPSSLVTRVTWRSTTRFLTPQWLRVAALLAAGAALGVAAAAVP